MLLSRLLSGFAAVVAFSSVGHAADVHKLVGQVSINRGNGYVAVVGSTHGAPGDVVMAHPGGRGEIVYVDGCRQPVEPGQREIIAQDSPCRAGYAPRPWGMALAVGGTVGVGIYLMTKDDDKPKSP